MEKLLIVIADYANVTGNNKLNIMGLFNEINPSVYPYYHPSMFLILKMRAELGEYNTSKTIMIKMFEPDGKELLAIQQDFQIPQIQNGKRPEVVGVVQLNNIEFAKPGNYEFVVIVNGDPKGDVTVIANPPQQIVG
jgi:hypothetical protein